MKVLHLPNTHWYQRYLIENLEKCGVRAVQKTYPWGCYLSNCADDIIAEQPDVLHLHWPEAVFRKWTSGYVNRLVRYLYLRTIDESSEWGIWIYQTEAALRKIRAAGIKVIWTLHNACPHGADAQSDGAYHFLYQSVAQQVDGVIHHSDWGRHVMLARYNWPHYVKDAVIPFAYFPDLASAEWSRSMQREALNLDDETVALLYVGDIKPRKQLTWMAEGVAHVSDIPAHLYLIGSGDAGQIAELEASGKGRVNYLGSLEQEEVSRIARGMDALIATPEIDQLTSGAPHLAQSVVLPLISPDASYVRAVLKDLFWPCPPDGRALTQLLQEKQSYWLDPGQRKGVLDRLKLARVGYEGAQVAQKTKHFYEKVLSA